MVHNTRASISCPKCGEQGSIQDKLIKNKYGDVYSYPYVAHYQFDPPKAKATKIRWCYLGKRTTPKKR